MPFIRKSFYFLRHGETDWNQQQRIMGQSDIPLNKNGVLQAKTAAEKIQVLPRSGGVKWNKAVLSTLCGGLLIAASIAIIIPPCATNNIF